MNKVVMKKKLIRTVIALITNNKQKFLFKLHCCSTKSQSGTADVFRSSISHIPINEYTETNSTILL